MKHRKEEDDLYRKFAHHREEEDRRIREEFRVCNDWSGFEKANKKSDTIYLRFTNEFFTRLQIIYINKISIYYAWFEKDEWEKELEQLSARWEREKGGRVRTQQFQQEKEDLEKNMTLRRDKKKESLTRKMLEHERYLLRN